MELGVQCGLRLRLGARLAGRAVKFTDVVRGGGALRDDLGWGC